MKSQKSKKDKGDEKMILSEQIAKIIEDMLERGNGTVNVQRNDLAQTLGCVPSQISYVISSRFTPERGYVTESRRGGGGYIKIVRVPMTANQYLMHFYHAIGGSVSEKEAKAYVRNLADAGVIYDREADIMLRAVSDDALSKLSPDGKNAVRADILRQIIMALMR